MFFLYKAVGCIGCEQLVYLEKLFGSLYLEGFHLGGGGRSVLFCRLFSTLCGPSLDYKVDTYYLQCRYVI